MAKDTKQIIIDTITDLVGSFLYYDRKEDQSLPRGKIEKAIEDGIISKEEIVQIFQEELFKSL